MNQHLWTNPVHGLGYNDPYGQTVPLRGWYPGLGPTYLSDAYGAFLTAQESGTGQEAFDQQMKRSWGRGWAIGIGVGALLGGAIGFFMGRR